MHTNKEYYNTPPPPKWKPFLKTSFKEQRGFERNLENRLRGLYKVCSAVRQREQYKDTPFFIYWEIHFLSTDGWGGDKIFAPPSCELSCIFQASNEI